ncbi:MAG: DNRLRE domain-containing protein, partial [Candidatus Thorarchaeota archaeon]
MKIATTFLILILTFSMFSIAIPIASNPTTDLAIHNTTSTLAATPGYEATVIRVTDDAPVTESSPDTNYELSNLLDCSNASGDLSRSWLKFNLTHLPNSLHFTKATVNLFTVSGVGSADYPRGIFISENDSWTEKTITWNDQPEYNSIPADVIDSPASPDMF